MEARIHPSDQFDTHLGWDSTRITRGRTGGTSSLARPTAAGRATGIHDGRIDRVLTSDRTAEVRFDHVLNRIIVKIRSKATGELIRQIPSEDSVRFIRRLSENAGALFDGTA